MKWYQNLYVGEKAKKKKEKIIRKVNRNAGMVGIYLITFASNSHDLFDIISTATLKQKVVYRNCPCIVGIACGYEEAIEVVLLILQEVYQNTGGFQARSYLENKVREEEI